MSERMKRKGDHSPENDTTKKKRNLEETMHNDMQTENLDTETELYSSSPAKDLPSSANPVDQLVEMMKQIVAENRGI